MKSAFHIVAIIMLTLSSDLTYSQVVYSSDHVDLIKLEENIFLLQENSRFPVNSLVIEGDSGLLIIDTGFKDLAADFVDAVSFLEKEVKVIINTHGHQDHVGANSMFTGDVLVIGHVNCKEIFALHDQKVKTFDDEITLEFSGHQVMCRSFSGGHSECDILTYIPELKLAYLGDVYLSQSFPLVIINDGSKVQTLVSNLREVHETLPGETRLIPGHGKESTMDELGNYIAMLDVTIELVRKEMEKGKLLHEIKSTDLLADWSDWGKFFPFISKNSWIEQIYLSYGN